MVACSRDGTLHVQCTVRANGVVWMEGNAWNMPGTVGGGSISESVRKGYPARCLEPGDTVEIEVEGIGTLRNRSPRTNASGAGMSTSHAEHPELAPPRVEEVSEGIYAYLQPDGSWFLNNTGFLVGRNGVVSIDTTSTERRTRAYLESIARVTNLPVRTLVNTHHHGDHTHGNCLLPLATIIGHPRCREEILSTPFPPPAGVWSNVEWGDLHPEPPFVTFDDHITVWVDDLRVELHAVPTPAHTTNDVVAWIPDRSVLFTGDLLFVGGTPFVPMGSVSGSLRALEWLRAFDAQTLVPGHGPVSAAAAIDGVEAYLRFVQDTARRGKDAGLSPLELARQTDLGAFAELTDAERIVGNLYRAYAELDGAEPGAPIDTRAALMDMVAFNGGQPLHCLA